MSKARNLADIISGAYDVPSGALGNVPETDLTPVKQDVAVLAFQSARNDNQAAYSLPNAFVDQFEDESGIDTSSAIYDGNTESLLCAGTATVNLTNGMNGGSASANNGGTAAPGSTSYTGYDGVTRSNASLTGSGSSYTGLLFGYVFQPTEDFEVIVYAYGQYQGTGYGYKSTSFALSDWHMGQSYWDSSATSMVVPSGVTYRGQYHSPISSDGANNYYNLYRYARVSGATTIQYYGRTTSAFDIDATAIAGVRSSTNYVGSIGSSTDTSNTYLALGFGEASGGTNTFRIEVANKSLTYNNATANFTGVTQSASSSISEMSIVVMYEDSAGTATLNTDLVVQVSANNGTDWTTVTLSAAPNLTNSIKVAKSAAVAVTAGTQPKYKISFANQASGSKETRVLGVSLLY